MNPWDVWTAQDWVHHYASALGLHVSPLRVLWLGVLGVFSFELWRKSFAVRVLGIIALPLAVGWLVHLVWLAVFGSGGH